VCKTHFAFRNHSWACWNLPRVVIIFVPFNIALRVENQILRVEITLFIWKKSHSAWRNHTPLFYTFSSEITPCVWTIHYACEHHMMRVNIFFCVWTSHNTFRNHIFSCQNYTSCENRTLRVSITLERVVIIVVSVIMTHINHILRIKSYSAYWSCTLRVKVALCVQKSLLCVLKLHSCLLKSHSCVFISHF
jgi:hypothetical protein